MVGQLIKQGLTVHEVSAKVCKCQYDARRDYWNPLCSGISKTTCMY